MTAQRPSRTGVLILSALGVVFGDIGTSPLYALRECFDGVHAIPVTVGNVYGVLSLVFWTITVVVAPNGGRWCCSGFSARRCSTATA